MTKLKIRRLFGGWYEIYDEDDSVVYTVTQNPVKKNWNVYDGKDTETGWRESHNTLAEVKLYLIDGYR